jgi:hypothetical protein
MLTLFLVIGSLSFSGFPEDSERVQDQKEVSLEEVMSRYRTSVPDESSGINGWVYDDRFAGVWYCNSGNLNIGVTSNSGAQGRNSSVVYHARRFSYNFLDRIHGVLSDLMSEYSLFSVAMTPQYNQVEVRLTNENYIANIERHLLDLSLFEEEAVRFVIDKEIPTPTSRPIHAGGRIYSTISGVTGGGTISAKAVCNITGRRGVITNAHVAGSLHRNLRDYRTPGWGGGSIAASRAQYLMEGLADAAFIPFTNPNDWAFSSSASWLNNPTDDFEKNDHKDFTRIPKTYQVASRDDIVAGRPVAKFGQTTGRTEGIIEAVRVTVRVGEFYDGTTRRFTDQIRHTARSRGGDSGAPLFFMNNGRYVLVATHFSERHASKITNVVGALNVTILSDEEFLQAGVYNIPLVFSQINPAAGTNMYLYGNDASFNVQLSLSNGATRTFQFTGNGTTTIVSSLSWPTLNGTFNFDFVRIGFWNNSFTIHAPNEWHASFNAGIGVHFNSMRIEVTQTSNQNLISTNFSQPFNYNVLPNGTLRITGAKVAFQGDLNIPSIIDGRTVTQIGAYAFYNQIGITSVTIPRTVTSFGQGVFAGCTNLNNVTVASGNAAFRIQNGCLIDIAAKTVLWGSGAIITIPSGIEFIGDSAFQGRTDLINVVLPTSLIHIGNSAFEGCVNLTSIVLHQNVGAGFDAFKDCHRLTIYTEGITGINGLLAFANPSNRPVIWRCTLSADKTYVVSIDRTANAIQNPANHALSAPYRDGYHTFYAFYRDANFLTGRTYINDFRNASPWLYFVRYVDNNCVWW